MSYLVVLFNLSSDVVSVDDLSEGDDMECIPLGSHEEIETLLHTLFPDADVSDPTWISVHRDDYVIEFMVGDGDPVESLGLRIHGGDEAIDVARALCAQKGWRAYDTTLGDFIDFDANPTQGLQAWRAYRDRVLGEPD